MNGINQITPLWDVMPLTSTEETTVGKGQASPDLVFGDIFQSAIENVKETSSAKTQADYLLATGQMDNPAEWSITASKASLAVDLLVELRNKALDAYSELMRISL